MGESKKYYWLKLKRDFFKRHDIQIIEAMPNGKDYILFYLKLLCESVDHEGALRFSEQIPYNDQMLATITNTNVDIVRSAITVFTELEMMEMLDDGTLFMCETQKMLGCETEWAKKKREYRRGLLEDNERTKKDNVRQEIEIEKEIDIDIEIEKEIETADRTNYQEIVDLYNSICVSYPKIKSLSDARKRSIKARLKKYSIDDIKLMFEKAEQSDFLKGGNNRNWSASFDWLMKDTNIAKVLDGNYDNKPMTPKTNNFNNFKQNVYDFQALEEQLLDN